jgi:hypothetical protein
VKKFEKAFVQAEQRLNKPACSVLYGGDAAAFETLHDTSYRFVPMGAPQPDSRTGEISVRGAATSGRNVFINSQGPFLNQNIFVPGHGLMLFDNGTGLRGPDFGSMLLHELGHGTHVFGPDVDNAVLNASYTRQVLKSCF